MSPELYITGLVAAIGSMATVITVMWKTILASKDALIASHEQRVADRDVVIADKDKQIANLMGANQALDSKVDQTILVLKEAISVMKASPQLPSNKSQGGSE